MPKKLTQEEVKNKLLSIGLELISEYINGSSKIKVKCRCGNVFKVTARNVLYGNTISCGCYHKNMMSEMFSSDLIGVVFDRLTVVERCGTDKHKKALWKCRCDCGNISYVSTGALASGNTKSCGCYKIDKLGNRFMGYKEISGVYWGALKDGAKRRNLLFEISIEDAWELFILQNRRCALSNEPLRFVRNYKKTNEKQTASLDRIDSSVGYILSNIQWVHKQVNRMKWDLDMNRFLTLVDEIYLHRVKHN